MHNKIYDDITILAKFLITILIIVMFIITKSVYIILFTFFLELYLLLLNNYRIGEYFKILRNYLILILIGFIVLLLFKGFNILYVFKYLVIILLINFFVTELNFEKTNTLVYKIIRSKYISYKITMLLYYINSIFSSRAEIVKFQKERSRKRYGIKYRLFARIEYAKYKANKLDNNYKTSFYTIKNEKCNLISVVMTIFFIFLLVMVIIRK